MLSLIILPIYAGLFVGSTWVEPLSYLPHAARERQR
jgi:hypothetical protein